MDAKKILRVSLEIGRLFNHHKITAAEARIIIDGLKDAQFAMETDEEFSKLEDEARTKD